MALRILYDVPTVDLQSGDAVVQGDGQVGIFDHTETIDGSEYVAITWRESAGGRLTWITTAQPWNEWHAVIREH